ncbi:facilitated glucose transporter protein 1 [Holotrichia oblita]|uniref:Facilitated glucose transporter protein 1 n=2 Tax=Holotrichia oblita TaxID=644536 RepID=A0ACB9TGA2_HOLOL|nr:facilitated glucose transporter protein 1 [Holotrichia oblita]KAI4465841.1 facilitated glucose transporter protein 1 [Holotrichia oblita]
MGKGGNPNFLTLETKEKNVKSYNVEEKQTIPVKSEFNGKLAFAIAAAALGSSFQHGYNTGVLNNPQTLIEGFIEQVLVSRTGASPSSTTVTTIWSIITSIFCVGGMVGGAITGVVAERFGRKGGLLLNNILVVFAVIFMGAAKQANSYEMIIVGRFLIGINSGLNAGLAPMYLSEISPVNLRGAIGSVYQLVITISILVAQILGLGSILGTADHWPTLLILTVVPAAFQLVTLPICPESPKYLLLSKNKEIEAQRALTWLRASGSVQEEMDEMRQEYEAMKILPKITIKELVSNNALRIPLIISLVMMIAQQLSGINAVIFYSTDIFKGAGLTLQAATYATLAIGGVNVLMTIISVILVERAGRKTLLLVGFGGMIIDTFLLTIALQFSEHSIVAKYMCVFLVVMFIILFATGPGSIPWFLVSELFSQSARPAATSLAVSINWIANFLVTIGFPTLQVSTYIF